MNRISTEILIVGGGAAGLSAAAEASTKANVTIVDDNPNLGGQVWRAELGQVKAPEAKRLIEQAAERFAMSRPPVLEGRLADLNSLRMATPRPLTTPSSRPGRSGI